MFWFVFKYNFVGGSCCGFGFGCVCGWLYIQYVQLKNVFKEIFPELMTQLMTDHREMKYELQLPDENQSNNSATKKIPASNIAKVLKKWLINKQARDAVEIGHGVIDCFRLLYLKYIDSSNADFMVNIKSETRQTLTIMLDCLYFMRIQRINSNKNNNHNSDASASLSVNVNGLSDNNIPKSFINIEFDKYTSKNEENATNEMVIEWLLKHIMFEMESAVLQVSALMNDSFIRFKSNDEEFEYISRSVAKRAMSIQKPQPKLQEVYSGSAQDSPVTVQQKHERTLTLDALTTSASLGASDSGSK